jgi:hypothetical protein
MERRLRRRPTRGSNHVGRDVRHSTPMSAKSRKSIDAVVTPQPNHALVLTGAVRPQHTATFGGMGCMAPSTVSGSNPATTAITPVCT